MKTTGVGAEFPVVCVGGSAGGLDAYTRLLRHLPADMGVAIVIVNHLRTVATHLHQILPRYTNMPVELITDRLIIQPNDVFIIPEQRDLHVLDGEFRLEPISKPRGWPDVITIFLRSLTENWDGQLIAVIVSGYDGDGAAALRAGVTTMQQDSRGFGASGGFSANGVRSESNNYLLDGIDNDNDSQDFLNGTFYVALPPVDAIAEFKVETAN
jgi:two-component system chemotaxis response regulator CheB